LITSNDDEHRAMKFTRPGCKYSALMLAVCIAACTTQVAQVRVNPPQIVPPGVDSKPIQLKKISSKLAKGDPIGTSRFTLLCIPGPELEWKDGRSSVTDEEFTERFKTDLTKYNYKVVGDSTALFEDPSAWRAEILVAGVITSIDVDACAQMSDFGNWRDAKGGAVVKVQWQVFGQQERKVIYEVTTEGSFHTEDSEPGGVPMLLTSAFSAATQNLMADPGFFKLVLKPRNAAKPAGGKTALEPIQIAIPTEPLSGVAEAKSAAVFVSAGPRYGAGVVISHNGYVLASQSVVESAHVVKVRLGSGVEVVGVVVRSFPQSEVALIKVNEKNLPAAELRLTPSGKVGEEVFAVSVQPRGTTGPSISRGAIGSARGELGAKYLQSDAKLNADNAGAPLLDKDGKVIGIAAFRPKQNATTSSTPTYFIPVDDAMARLALSLK
jgi:S1-C subfamily serine protease